MGAHNLFLFFHSLPMTNFLHYFILKPVGNKKYLLNCKIPIDTINYTVNHKFHFSGVYI